MRQSAKHDDRLPSEARRLAGAGLSPDPMTAGGQADRIAPFPASRRPDDIVAQTCTVDGGNWMN